MYNWKRKNIVIKQLIMHLANVIFLLSKYANFFV